MPPSPVAQFSVNVRMILFEQGRHLAGVAEGRGEAVGEGFRALHRRRKEYKLKPMARRMYLCENP